MLPSKNSTIIILILIEQHSTTQINSEATILRCACGLRFESLVSLEKNVEKRQIFNRRTFAFTLYGQRFCAVPNRYTPVSMYTSVCSLRLKVGLYTI